MIVKNNYNECITNLACSIRKYFNLEYRHNTLEYIDKLLEEKKPKNVVTILCDGMGSNIMDRMLEANSFLIKHRLKPITTVFPATTVAATTSMMTGLNPVETAMLGWDMYYKDIDKTITTFFHSAKEDAEHKPLPEAREYNDKHMIRKSIMEEINEKGIDTGLYYSQGMSVRYDGYVKREGFVWVSWISASTGERRCVKFKRIQHQSIRKICLRLNKKVSKLFK